MLTRFDLDCATLTTLTHPNFKGIQRTVQNGIGTTFIMPRNAIFRFLAREMTMWQEILQKKVHMKAYGNI